MNYLKFEILPPFITSFAHLDLQPECKEKQGFWSKSRNCKSR